MVQEKLSVPVFEKHHAWTVIDCHDGAALRVETGGVTFLSISIWLRVFRFRGVSCWEVGLTI